MRFASILLLVTCIGLSAFQCDDSDTACENQEWLNKKLVDLRNSTTSYTVKRYEYRGKQVFLIDQCHGCADAMEEVYDCAGTLLCQFGGIAGLNTCPDFADNATLIDVLEKRD